MSEPFTREAIESNLIEVFSKYKHGNVEVQRTSVITADLGVDSLAVMEIVAELEDTFDLTFPDEDLPNVKTVADVADMIVRGLKESGRLHARRCEAERKMSSEHLFPHPHAGIVSFVMTNSRVIFYHSRNSTSEPANSRIRS